MRIDGQKWGRVLPGMTLWKIKKAEEDGRRRIRDVVLTQIICHLCHSCRSCRLFSIECFGEQNHVLALHKRPVCCQLSRANKRGNQSCLCIIFTSSALPDEMTASASYCVSLWHRVTDWPRGHCADARIMIQQCEASPICRLRPHLVRDTTVGHSQ